MLWCVFQVCVDVNECQESVNGGCSELRECENTMGSFRCGPCPAGYVEDGDFGCQFSDPCAAGVHNCQKTEYCNNYALGQFNCFVSDWIRVRLSQDFIAFFKLPPPTWLLLPPTLPPPTLLLLLPPTLLPPPTWAVSRASAG